MAITSNQAKVRFILVAWGISAWLVKELYSNLAASNLLRFISGIIFIVRGYKVEANIANLDYYQYLKDLANAGKVEDNFSLRSSNEIQMKLKEADSRFNRWWCGDERTRDQKLVRDKIWLLMPEILVSTLSYLILPSLNSFKLTLTLQPKSSEEPIVVQRPKSAMLLGKTKAPQSSSRLPQPSKLSLQPFVRAAILSALGLEQGGTVDVLEGWRYFRLMGLANSRFGAASMSTDVESRSAQTQSLPGLPVAPAEPSSSKNGLGAGPSNRKPELPQLPPVKETTSATSKQSEDVLEGQEKKPTSQKIYELHQTEKLAKESKVLGDLKNSLVLWNRCFRIAQELYPKPDTITLGLILEFGLESALALQQMGRYDEAESNLKELLSRYNSASKRGRVKKDSEMLFWMSREIILQISIAKGRQGDYIGVQDLLREQVEAYMNIPLPIRPKMEYFGRNNENLPTVVNVLRQAAVISAYQGNHYEAGLRIQRAIRFCSPERSISIKRSRSQTDYGRPKVFGLRRTYSPDPASHRRGDESLTTTGALVQIGQAKVYSLAGRYRLAYETIATVLKQLEMQSSDKHALILEARCWESRLLLLDSRVPEAERKCRATMKMIASGALGKQKSDHPLYLEALSTLILILIHRGSLSSAYLDAQTLFNKANSKLGPSMPQMLKYVSQLGMLSLMRGKYVQGEGLLLHTFQLAKNKWDEWNPYTIRYGSELALAQCLNWKIALAVRTARACLLRQAEIFTSAVLSKGSVDQKIAEDGIDNIDEEIRDVLHRIRADGHPRAIDVRPGLLSTLKILAKCLFRLSAAKFGNLVDDMMAKVCSERADGPAEKTGRSVYLLASTALERGQYLAKREKIDLAEEQFRFVLRKDNAAALGDSHPIVLAAREGVIYVATLRRDDAPAPPEDAQMASQREPYEEDEDKRSQLETILIEQEMALWKDHHDAIQTRALLLLYELVFDADTWEATCTELLKILWSVLPERFVEALRMLLNTARALHDIGKTEAAGQIFGEISVVLRDAKKRKEHRDMAKALQDVQTEVEERLRYRSFDANLS